MKEASIGAIIFGTLLGTVCGTLAGGHPLAMMPFAFIGAAITTFLLEKL